LVLAAAGFSVCGVNEWSDRSHIFVIPVAAGGLGFAGLKRFTSGT
jgi:hypothetical protein